MKRFFAALIGTALLMTLICYGVGYMRRAHAAEPTIENTRPPPVMAHGLTQCGEVVALWVFIRDDKGLVSVYRTDAMNHPETVGEYNAFLDWIQTTPKGNLDIIELPCKK